MIINGPMLIEAAPIKDMIPEKRTYGGASYGLAEVGYDIRLKQDVFFKPNPFGEGDVRVDDEKLDGNFTLASAIEEFNMPTNLVGIVHDKSTWARKGLSVFNTVIEPGWRGFLTLELVHHGRDPLFLLAGTGIAQVIFHQLAFHSSYVGKYQDQADKPVEAVLGLTSDS